MGRQIDRAAGFLLATAAMYLFFLNAWHSIPLACAAAFAAMALGRFLLRGVPRRRRCTRAQAADEVLRIAALPDGEAERALGEIIRRRYPGEDFALAAILKHPAASLSPSDVLAAWKANRGAARLVVAATCGCDPAAALYARELAEPAVAVVDQKRLARLIRDGGFLPPNGAPAFSARRAWHSVLRHVAAHRMTPKDALAAALLLAMYWLFGHPLYLILSLLMLLRLGMLLPLRRGKKQLFE